MNNLAAASLNGYVHVLVVLGTLLLLLGMNTVL